MNILGVIPSRYQSSRYPGKPLIDIRGKSMIQRVYEQAARSKYLSKIIVATDDERIASHVHHFGGIALMTSPNHKSGTDRCAEVIKYYPEMKAFINIQGDEPLIDPSQIDLVASCFEDPVVEVATLIKKIEDKEELFNENLVKVVIDHFSRALYFSRSVIPFVRGRSNQEWINETPYQKHIGIYGFRKDILETIRSLKPSGLEIAESLEQLRWLQNGITITVRKTNIETQAIDTPDDLKKVLKLLK